MINIFDPKIGWQKKTLGEIQTQKSELLEKKLGFSIDKSSGSLWSILNHPSSFVDLEINQMIGTLLTQLVEFISDVQNQVSIPASSTLEAILTRSSSLIPHLEFISIDDTSHPRSQKKAGEMEIFYIFAENFSHTDYQKQIWQAIHTLKEAGIATKGAYEVSDYGSNGQLFNYHYSLGKRKYVYIRVKYFSDSVNYIMVNVDSTIKDIYQNIVENLYKKISRDLHYQDFTTVTHKITGVSKIDFYYHISENPNLVISEIPLEKFSLNTNHATDVSDVLIFDFTKRILIERSDV